MNDSVQFCKSIKLNYLKKNIQFYLERKYLNDLKNYFYISFERKY